MDEDKDRRRVEEYYYYHDRIAEFVGMLGADFPNVAADGTQASVRILRYLELHESKTRSISSLMGLLLVADLLIERITDHKANPYPEVDQ